MSEPLKSMHRSLKAKRKYAPPKKANGMDSMDISNEQREVVEKISLGIFTDMVNAGFSLQETLSAIYVSGVQHALSIVNKGKLS